MDDALPSVDGHNVAESGVAFIANQPDRGGRDEIGNKANT